MHTNARTYTYCEQAWSGKRKGYGKYASNTKDANTKDANTKDARYGGKTKANTKGNLKSPAANLIGRAITSNVHMQPGGSKEASLLKATTISSFKTAYHGIEHPQCSKSIYIQPTTVSSTRNVLHLYIYSLPRYRAPVCGRWSMQMTVGHSVLPFRLFGHTQCSTSICRISLTSVWVIKLLA